MTNKAHCAGCYKDFYNYQYPGQDCWNLESAKLVKAQIVHIQDTPPYKHPIKVVPSCWSGERLVAIPVE